MNRTAKQDFIMSCVEVEVLEEWRAPLPKKLKVLGSVKSENGRITNGHDRVANGIPIPCAMPEGEQLLRLRKRHIG